MDDGRGGGGEEEVGKPPQTNLTYKIQKKEEFPGFMVYMLSGNSFPQICVVSD
jgi:hypothetical protein